MNSQSAAQLLTRAKAVLASGRAEMTGELYRADVEGYLDPARFKRERALMRRHPQPVVAAAEVASPGSWWSGDVLGAPLLVTRDASGTLRAFLNVCRHRGARVVEAGSGCGRERFSCPYHAWTYAADGRLLNLPKPEGFPGIEPEQSGLRPLAVAERTGVVWVIPEPREAHADVTAALGPFAQELSAFGLDSHVPYAPRVIELRCNWKLMVEGSSEAYHFKIAHRQTIASMFVDNLQIVDEAGLHRRMFIVRESLRDREADETVAFAPREFGNLLYFFFPSTMLLVQPDHAQLTRIEPLDPDRTRLHEFALIPEPVAGDKARSHWERNVALYRAALGEDYAQMESIQAGLASGANAALSFGCFESALARFNQQLDAELAGGT